MLKFSTAVIGALCLGIMPCAIMSGAVMQDATTRDAPRPQPGQSRAEQSRAEQSRAEQSRAEQSRAEQSKPDDSKALGKLETAEEVELPASLIPRTSAKVLSLNQSIEQVQTSVLAEASASLVRGKPKSLLVADEVPESGVKATATRQPLKPQTPPSTLALATKPSAQLGGARRPPALQSPPQEGSASDTAVGGRMKPAAGAETSSKLAKAKRSRTFVPLGTRPELPPALRPSGIGIQAKIGNKLLQFDPDLVHSDGSKATRSNGTSATMPHARSVSETLASTNGDNAAADPSITAATHTRSVATKRDIALDATEPAVSAGLDEPASRRQRMTVTHHRSLPIVGMMPSVVSPKPYQKALAPFAPEQAQPIESMIARSEHGSAVELLNPVAYPETMALPTLTMRAGLQIEASGESQNQMVMPVAHNEIARSGAASSNSVATDLVVGTLPSSSRRGSPLRENNVVAQVAQIGVSNQPVETIPVQAGIQPLKLPPQRNQDADSEVSIEGNNDLVSLTASDEELRDILRIIADHHGLNLVIGPDVEGPVTVDIQGAKLSEVLDGILGVAGFHWHRSGNLLYVTSTVKETVDPKVQGRRVQVYPLNYVSSSDIEPVVTRMLSSIGTVFSSQAVSDDQLRTRELLIVEDIDAAHERISQCIAQLDVQPRQVLVEAHVLQIDLGDEERCGVNLRGLARLSRTKMILEGSGFAEEDPEGPSIAFRIDGTDVKHLIEAIHANTNSRTLASPKVSVVNRQMAKVQIGQRLPYAVATTTQTATIQNVQFLDVGIVLEVTPVITSDGNILMTVLPKVSGGKITESGFPEEDTTQVSTTVLMPNGGGLVIGGLIREVNSETRATVPKLGKISVIKYLFNKRAAECRRSELVVALVTHIMDGNCSVRQKEQYDLEQTLPVHASSELHFAPEIRYSSE